MPTSKYLFVGDVHAVPEELDDCRALMGLVKKVALETGATVVLLGDQHNTHGVIRAEVMWFWKETFRDWTESDIQTMALVGNHDYAGEGLSIHSMASYEDDVQIVDCPQAIGQLLFVPYYADREKLLADVKREGDSIFGNETLVCHQTFVGAKYENGFYAEDGVDPELFPQKHIISGHIHSPSTFGKVTYIGAPRWRTLSDANVERAIWVYEFDEDGEPVSKTPYDTSTVCRQIRYLVDSPDSPVSEELDPRHDWRIDVKGPKDWIEKRKTELGKTGVRLRTFSTEKSTPKVRESEGVSVAFQKYIQSYVPKHGTDKTTLQGLATERLGV